MQSDWAGVHFDSMPWRSSGSSILRGVDDIQQLLDDQVVKTQAMRASPYIGPFEDGVKTWEAKLNQTQVSCTRCHLQQQTVDLHSTTLCFTATFNPELFYSMASQLFARRDIC